MRTHALLARAHMTFIWLLVTAAAVVCALAPSQGVPPKQVLYVLGFAFLGAFVGAFAVARRPMDLAGLIVAALGGTFGFWFPTIHESLGTVAPLWASRLPWMPEDIAVMLPLGATVLFGGVCIGLGLGVATGSLRLMGQTVLASVGAAIGAMLLRHGDWTLIAAIIGWNTLLAAELGRWAVAEAMKQSGIGCPNCGHDLRDLGTPVCPKCHHAIARRSPAPSPAA